MPCAVVSPEDVIYHQPLDDGTVSGANPGPALWA